MRVFQYSNKATGRVHENKYQAMFNNNVVARHSNTRLQLTRATAILFNVRSAMRLTCHFSSRKQTPVRSVFTCNLCFIATHRRQW